MVIWSPEMLPIVFNIELAPRFAQFPENPMLSLQYRLARALNQNALGPIEIPLTKETLETAIGILKQEWLPFSSEKFHLQMNRRIVAATMIEAAVEQGTLPPVLNEDLISIAPEILRTNTQDIKYDGDDINFFDKPDSLNANSLRHHFETLPSLVASPILEAICKIGDKKSVDKIILGAIPHINDESFAARATRKFATRHRPTEIYPSNIATDLIKVAGMVNRPSVLLTVIDALSETTFKPYFRERKFSNQQEFLTVSPDNVVKLIDTLSFAFSSISNVESPMAKAKLFAVVAAGARYILQCINVGGDYTRSAGSIAKLKNEVIAEAIRNSDLIVFEEAVSATGCLVLAATQTQTER